MCIRDRQLHMQKIPQKEKVGDIKFVFFYTQHGCQRHHSALCSILYHHNNLLSDWTKKKKKSLDILHGKAPPAVHLDTESHSDCVISIIYAHTALGLVTSEPSTLLVWQQRHQWYRKYRTDKHSCMKF